MGAHRVRTGRTPSRGARLITVALTLILLAAGAQSAVATPVGHITEFSNGINANSQPRGIVAAADGALWFADTGANPAIGRADTSGNIKEYNLPPGAVPLDVAAVAGFVWFTDASPGLPAIGRIDLSSGRVTEFTSGMNGGATPTAIAAGPDGNLWFTDRGSPKAIGRFNPATGQINEVPLPVSSNPRGIARGPDGNMWFGDSGAHKLGRLIPSTQHIDEFNSGLNPGSSPFWVAPGRDGRVWFTDQGAPTTIGVIDPSTGVANEAVTSGMPPGSIPLALVTGQDGNLWFADFSGAVDQVDLSTGQIHKYTAGLQPGPLPVGIWPGQDGNVWFADGAGRIGQVGTGAPAALQSAPSVVGSRRAGDAQSCRAQWSTWAGINSVTLGYTWFRSGAPIAGQNSQSYTPSSSDVGQPISCRASVYYDLPLLVPATATSAAVTVRPPNLSHLRVKGRCVAHGRKSKRRARCHGRVKLAVSFKLAAASNVLFTIKRVRPGRKVKGRCVSPTRQNRKHKKCKRLSAVKHARFTRKGHSGRNKVKLKAPKLAPGTYELVATPRVNGHTGTQRAFTFKIAG